MITSLLTSLASSLTGWISLIPNILLFLLVTVIALVYFAIDLEKINTRVRSFLPKSLSERLSGVREGFLQTSGKYIGAYLLLMLETFGILLVGFVILRIERAFSLALIVSVLDLLPIIGVGTVLVPWSIISFVTGDRLLGVGLLLLFVVNTVIRELTEPRIVGKSLDMHPLMTLAFIYVGYALFGLSGLVALPALAMLFGAVFNNRHSAEVDKSAGKK
jgi:sporulation integral membrane protein YtvI